MDMIVNWVEGGAPEGNADYLPPKPRMGGGGSEPRAAARKLEDSVTLDSAWTVAGIRPEGPVEVAALLPDGSVRRLLWVRTFRAEWNRTYWLRSPMRLPKGTRLVLSGSAAVVFGK
jgi:hypothetical protein